MAQRRESVAVSSVRSTEAQNNFGEVLARVSREGRVFITRYGRPEAVVMSMDAYRELVPDEPIDLEALERAFDERLAHMQTAEHRAGVDALFRKTTAELGEAAVTAARSDN
jgi:prevent-host-death family protein